MKLSDFYNEVARRVDTDKTAINAAETKRVLSEAFLVLAAMDASEFADTVSKELSAPVWKPASEDLLIGFDSAVKVSQFSDSVCENFSKPTRNDRGDVLEKV